MKPKEITDIIDFIAKSGLEEVNIETEEFKINVKKSLEAAAVTTVAAAPAAAAVAPIAAAPAAAPVAAPAASSPAEAAPSANTHIIKSPMIGTFYRSTSPDQPVLVSVGDKVTLESKVCIVEAMKLFNEIEAEVSGTIIKVLVEDASPIEFDQPLFEVELS